MSLGRFIYRWRWAVVLFWLAAVVSAFLWKAPAMEDREQASFLPSDSPYGRALEQMRRAFPDRSGLSQAVVVFERHGAALTAADRAAIEAVADRARQTGPDLRPGDLDGVHVRSPADIALPSNPMVSELRPQGQAALILADIPANFITMRSARVVKHIRHMVASTPLPEGLSAAVTGSSGFGYDYAQAAEQSHRSTTLATLAAVVVILLLVYRAPIAAMIPLGAISLAAIVAMNVLALGTLAGMHVGTAEKIFVFVLIYGAGVDYSLLYVSRYREYLGQGVDKAMSAQWALDHSWRAIVASAGTNMAGLLMLCFAQYMIFRTTGPAVAVAMVVALAAALTLVPALVAIAGPRMFWPLRAPQGAPRQRLWPAVARVVTARPGMVMALTVALLAAPAWQGYNLRWVYDTFVGLDEDEFEAARGYFMAKRNWSAGEVTPLSVLVCFDRPLTGQQSRQFSQELAGQVQSVAGIETVRSLAQPLGPKVNVATQLLLSTVGQGRVEQEFVSPDRCSLRMVASLSTPAYSLDAMTVARDARQKAQALAERFAATNHLASPEVHLLGATAEMEALRDLTGRDFHMVSALAMAVILLIVMGLLRDWMLSAFMVGSTVLSYLATLGITGWVFTWLLGSQGLDWKVQVFLFVVMVAVGQDYNIFLAARLAEEARLKSAAMATRDALVHTGPVISSCGLIMAATLGSLMFGTLTLMRQLGFALAVGMLLDTFLVRPLLLPAFVALTGRTGRLGGKAPAPAGSPREPAGSID